MASSRMRWARSWFLTGAIMALLASACMGGDDEAENTNGTGAQTNAETEPATLLPPSDLTAELDGLTIVVSWVAPSGDPEVVRYSVYRNGSFFRSILAPEVSFTDTDVSPGMGYSYGIEGRAGDLVSDRVTVEATAPTPSLREARVEGTFNVRTKKLSSSGYSQVRAPALGWQFRPRCSQGPCDVRWRDLQQKRLSTVFNRRGARYRGSYTGFFYVLCSGVRSTSSVSIRFKVDAARAIGAEWRATRLLGMLNQSEAAQLGCAPSQGSFSIRAKLIL